MSTGARSGSLFGAFLFFGCVLLLFSLCSRFCLRAARPLLSCLVSLLSSLLDFFLFSSLFFFPEKKWRHIRRSVQTIAISETLTCKTSPGLAPPIRSWTLVLVFGNVQSLHPHPRGFLVLQHESHGKVSAPAQGCVMVFRLKCVSNQTLDHCHKIGYSTTLLL